MKNTVVENVKLPISIDIFDISHSQYGRERRDGAVILFAEFCRYPLVRLGSGYTQDVL